MTRFRQPKLRTVLILALMGTTVFLLTGCATLTKTSDHYALAIWKEPSGNIIWNWASPTCNQDVDRNGVSGTPHDRALCAFFITRATVCNNLADTARIGCEVGTTADGKDTLGRDTWRDFDFAARNFVHDGNDCMVIWFGAFGDMRTWTTANLGQQGCRTVSG